MINPIETYNAYLQEINGYEQERRHKDNPDSYSASGAGLCHRKHYYNIHKYKKKPISDDSLRILRLGTIMVLVENGIGKMYDWKTCNSFKFKHIINGNHTSENYELQVGTYSLMALEMGLCKEINHMALLYYSKNDSKMKEHIISDDAIDKAKAYWKDVEYNVRMKGEPLMKDIEFKEGVAPVYKWECGRYCDYSLVCPSPLNKEFVK